MPFIFFVVLLRFSQKKISHIKSKPTQSEIKLNNKTPEGVYAGCVGLKYLRIMLTGVGRLSSVSTANVQERRRSFAHRLEILTLAKSISWLCKVKMDITYRKSNIVWMDKTVEYCAIHQ